MNESQKQRLSANIHMLGNLLGETIIEQEGQAIFELEEQIRSALQGLAGGRCSSRRTQSRRRCPS
jgi:phosphoenolpyruvate carboxylase